MSKVEREIETKILVTPEQFDALYEEWSEKAIDGKIKDKFRPRAYFDTKSRRLYQQKIALRVQYKEDKGFEQTIKYEAHEENKKKKSKDEPLERDEVKDFLKGKDEHPDLGLVDLDEIPDKDVCKTLKKCREKELKHVFTAAVKRKYFVIPVMEDGEVIGKVELAFDRGNIIHADETDLCEPVAEIEVELKEGDPKVVDMVVEEILSQTPGAKISALSKADVGYDLDAQAAERKQKRKDVAKNVKSDKKELPKQSRKMFPNK